MAYLVSAQTHTSVVEGVVLTASGAMFVVLGFAPRVREWFVERVMDYYQWPPAEEAHHERALRRMTYAAAVFGALFGAVGVYVFIHAIV